MSTQTENNIDENIQQLNNLQQQKQINKQYKIIQDWGETNFHINRWIYHNEALYKMFNNRK
jgi:hypothetical protein